jgi:hypothetical protein
MILIFHSEALSQSGELENDNSTPKESSSHNIRNEQESDTTLASPEPPPTQAGMPIEPPTVFKVKLPLVKFYPKRHYLSALVFQTCR